MLSFQDAQRTMLEAVPEPGRETVALRRALGRVPARDLSVPRDYPDTRRSAVDGYAVRFDGGTSFRPVGEVVAGQIPESRLEPGECVAVMTGGTVPDEADCVVMVEDCDETDGLVSVNVPLRAGALINEPGSEAASGEPLLRRGARLTQARYAALFYAGVPEVPVYEPPSVGVLITGQELREVEDRPAPGKAFNTNRYILEAFLHAVGTPCSLERQAPDDEDAMRQALDELSEHCAFVVSSGAVSMGRYDYVKKIFRESGFSLLVEGTRIKPGSPLMVAERDGKLFFGMPGYPAAFLTNALLYLVPALKKASGRSDYDHRPINATLKTPLHARRGRMDAARACLELENGEWFASDPGSQRTSHFLNFARVNGLVLVPESAGDLPAGSAVKALSFDLELT
jgi:molybdopterin molybdotransferase